MLSLRGRLEVDVNRSIKRDYVHNGISRKEVRRVVEFLMFHLTESERHYLVDFICDDLGEEEDFLIFDKEKLTVSEEVRVCRVYPSVIRTLNSLGHHLDSRFI